MEEIMFDPTCLRPDSRRQFAGHTSISPRTLAGHRLRQSVAPFFILAGIGLAFYPGVAAATIVNADEFRVTRSGSALFDDSFSANTTLVGGSGTSISSGVSFNADGTANYFVRGSIPETTANNGQAILNTANGIVVNQPPPFLSSIQQTSAFLESGTLTSQPHALTATTAFTSTALFDLAIPSVVNGTYALTLSNRFVSNGDKGNVLEIRVRNCQAGGGLCGADSGTVIQFAWFDFITNAETLISEVELSAAQLADPQLAFEFTKGAGTDVVCASYADGTGNTLASFSGALNSLGCTDSATDVFTASLQTVQTGIEAFDPVAIPEPPSFTLMLSGLIALGGLAWRRRRA
jgi:hypothetical protein